MKSSSRNLETILEKELIKHPDHEEIENEINRIILTHEFYLTSQKYSGNTKLVKNSFNKLLEVYNLENVLLILNNIHHLYNPFFYGVEVITQLFKYLESDNAIQLVKEQLNLRDYILHQSTPILFKLFQYVGKEKTKELIKNNFFENEENMIKILGKTLNLDELILICQERLHSKNKIIQKKTSEELEKMVLSIDKKYPQDIHNSTPENLKRVITEYLNIKKEKRSNTIFTPSLESNIKLGRIFIQDYLHSKYILNENQYKHKNEIITEIRELLENITGNYLDYILEYSKSTENKFKNPIFITKKRIITSLNFEYYKLSQIVKAGKASNLEEIIECSEFESTEGDLFLQKLGSGGVAGITYLVESPKLGSIAVKVLKKGKYNPKEVEVLNKLAKDEEKLENVVRFISAPSNQISRNGENVETIFMEFIDGQNLETIYNKNPDGLEESLALNYSRQLLKGILDLRRKEIFHRDIHLANVMVDNLGKLKIVDFGIAENNLNAEPESNLRHGGVTDLVSWAFITYELFSGEHLLYNRQTMIDNKTNIRDEIRTRRDEMLDENRRLKPEYLSKIHQNIPKSLFLPVTFALSHSDMEPISNVLKDYFFGFLYKPELEKYFISHGLNINGLNDSFYEGLENIININKKYII